MTSAWILEAVKAAWRERLTTVFPRQGHYAHDPRVESCTRPDVTIERISDLLHYDLHDLLQAARVK